MDAVCRDGDELSGEWKAHNATSFWKSCFAEQFPGRGTLAGLEMLSFPPDAAIAQSKCVQRIERLGAGAKPDLFGEIVGESGRTSHLDVFVWTTTSEKGTRRKAEQGREHEQVQ